MEPFALPATGNKVVLKVYQVTESGPHQCSRSADLEQARAAVPRRLQALRVVRGSRRGQQTSFSLPSPSSSMLLPSRRPFTPFALLFLAHGWLLAGCSSPAPTAPPAAEAVETLDLLPSALPFGVWVDVSNGLPRHFFGEPLRTFPRMRPIPPAPGDLTQGYVLTGPTRWYGKHRAQIRGPYCYFLDGQFYRFRVIADGAVLRPEAIDLFGPGQAQGPHRLLWEGYRARAVYVETSTPHGVEGRLDVVSLPLADTLAARQRARLQAENTR